MITLFILIFLLASFADALGAIITIMALAAPVLAFMFLLTMR